MSWGTQEWEQERSFDFKYGAITLLGSASQQILLSNNFVTLLTINCDVPTLQPPVLIARHILLCAVRLRPSLGSSVFARRYLRNSNLFLFHQVLKCFTSLGARMCLKAQTIDESIGFPHSDISGSKVARHLPGTYRSHATSFIASVKPRHPPYALINSH